MGEARLLLYPLHANHPHTASNCYRQRALLHLNSLSIQCLRDRSRPESEISRLDLQRMNRLRARIYGVLTLVVEVILVMRYSMCSLALCFSRLTTVPPHGHLCRDIRYVNRESSWPRT